MVKVSVLIGTILTTVGVILQFILFGQVFRNSSTAGIVLRNNIPVIQNTSDLTYSELMWYLSLNSAAYLTIWSFFVMPIVILGIILILLPSFKVKKPIWIIGSLLYIVGMILQLVVYWNNTHFSTFSKVADVVTFVALVVYFIGLITIRSSFKAGLVTGILLLILGFGVYILMGLMFDYNPSVHLFNTSRESYLNIYLGLQCGFTAVNVLHGLLFSFSRKVDVEEGVEDTMSIENGNAFESYVEPEKKKEKKKPKESDKVEFTF